MAKDIQGINNFSGATFCITGGTGSFGKTTVEYLLINYPQIDQIRVFSRDENKQDIMRNSIHSEKVKFYIGDTRDISSLDRVMKGVNYVFHAAALKQVPSCEFFPDQAVQTNILGSINVVESSIKHGINALVCLSTDKAVYPINSMGMTKALMEKVAQAPIRLKTNEKTKIAVTRYGNVMMSRGSVIPHFINQIRSQNKVTITNENMTRFLMSLEESVDLVMHAFQNADPGDLYVRKAPACTINTLANALIELIGNNETRKEFIGIRHGEKMFESLLSVEEMQKAIEYGNYYKVPIDTRDLNYDIYFDEGRKEKYLNNDGYTSNNTTQLNVEEVIDRVANLPEYKNMVKE